MLIEHRTKQNQRRKEKEKKLLAVCKDNFQAYHQGNMYIIFVLYRLQNEEVHDVDVIERK